MDDLHRRLREAADAHQPDREAMLARVEEGMTGTAGADRARQYRRRRQASWLKVSLAGVAGLGVLGLGGLAVAAGVQQGAPEHPDPPAATQPQSQNIVAATSTARPPSASATKPATSATPSSPSPSPSRHSTTAAADGSITAHGDIGVHSIVYWEQNDVTVDVGPQLTTLTVEMRIAETGGVQNTGNWRTAPSDDYVITVTQADGFLVYRWTLKPGRTVPAASRQIFAAQFNHDAGKRDTSKDTFRVDTTVAGRSVTVRGGFPVGN